MGREEQIRKLRQEGDPLRLTGNIGHFGVGAQNAVFFMGNMEHIMSRAVTATGKTPVEDMVISAKEMHDKYDRGDHKDVYDFPVHARALGDPKWLQGQEQHRGVTDMIAEEKTLSAPHFSMFVVSGIYSDHLDLLKDGRHLDELVQDIARMYNYYLHGTEDEAVQALECSDAESETSDEDEDGDGEDDLARSQAKRKRKQGGSGSAKKLKNAGGGGAKGGEESSAVLKNIDMQFVFEGPSGQRQIDLRREHNNIEFQMRRKMKSSFTFNLVLPDNSKGNGHKVAVRLYYFPKILDEETRPYDQFEEKRNLDKPIFSCYWEGRWIPFAHVDSVKKVFNNIEKDTQGRQLLRRLRGTMFFPHSYTPTHNKLAFKHAPQPAVDAEAVRVMRSESGWENDEERAVRVKFEQWIKECQKNFDRDIKFAMNQNKEPKYDARENRTYYDKLTYGLVEYRAGQKIAITIGKPHMFGEILSLWREGDTRKSDGSTYTGYIQLKRYPLESFGDENNSLKVEVTRLNHQALPEEGSRQEEQWRAKVAKLSEMLPHEILVLKGRSDQQDERLAAGALRPKERSRDNSEEISSAQLAIEAGYRIPPYDVVILNTKGKPVKDDVMQNQRLSRTKDHDQDTRGGGARQAKKNLSVKCVITLLKTANDEFADHLKYCNPVYEDTQSVQSKDLSYEFPGIGDAFDLAGTYELTYTMLGSDVYDVSGQVKPIVWKQTVVVTPNAPRKVDIDMDQDADTAVLSLGCEKLKWIECAFRDDFGLELGAGGAATKKGKGKGKSGAGGASAEGGKGKDSAGDDADAVEKTGNLCPVPRKLQLEFEDIKPIGLQLTARLCEKAADGKQHAAWHVKIEPTSKECPALSQLRKRAGERVDGQCTLVFTYKESKKKRGQDDTENRAIKRDKFKFKIEAGTPYELRLAGNKAVTGEQLARREDAMVMDNRGKIQKVSIQVVDRWGCLVSKYKGGALKVSEELVYVGDDPQVKARKIGDDSLVRSRREMGNTLNKILRDVHETKGRADVGDRVIVLQDPPVSKPEDHRLVCKLVNHKGEALDKECQLKTNSLPVSVTVKPSTFPQVAVVWQGNTAVQNSEALENPVITTAGGKQANVKFEFLDEAKRRVSLSKDDGWIVSGGGWGKKEVPCVCEQDFVKMPPGLMARTKVGDTSEHTIIFQGPPSEGGSRSTIKVNINLVPVAAKPHQWVVLLREAASATSASPAKSTSKAAAPRGAGAAAPTNSVLTRCEASKPVHIQSGQPLCDVLCLGLVDEYGNLVKLEEYQDKVQPDVLRTGGGDKVTKSWKEQTYAYDAAGNCFLFQSDMHLKGLTGHDKMELRVTTNTTASAPEWKDIKACMQTIQMAAGAPHRVRLSMAGFPFEAARSNDGAGPSASDTSSSKSRTLSTEVQTGQSFQDWPSVCQIEELAVEIVDEAGNLICTKHNSELTIKLALRGGKVFCAKSSPAGGSEQLDPIPIELKRAQDWFKKLKKVYIWGEPDSTASLEVSASIAGCEIRKAEASIRFVAANIVQRIELQTKDVPRNASAGQCVSLRARVHTQDGRPYEAQLIDALRCVLSRPSGEPLPLDAALIDICEHNLEKGKCDHCRVDICEHNKVRSDCDDPGCRIEQEPREWVQWQVSGDAVDKTGVYAFTVSFGDTRPQFKPLLEGLGLAKVSTEESGFSVLPGTAWHLRIQQCAAANAGMSMPTVSNIQDQNATNVVVKGIKLQLQDCHGNGIGAPAGGLKIAAFIALPSPDTRSKGMREVCAEVDFLFMNDSQRRERIREEKDKREKYVKERDNLLEDKRKNSSQFEKLQQKADEALFQLRQVVTLCSRLVRLRYVNACGWVCTHVCIHLCIYVSM